MSIKVLRVWFLALSALALALGLGSCGKVAEGNEELFDSNTNWLLRCREDEHCTGSLRCYCGICTKPCGENSECGLLSGAECAESGESLCGEQASAGGLCVLACTGDLDCGAGFSCSAKRILFLQRIGICRAKRFASLRDPTFPRTYSYRLPLPIGRGGVGIRAWKANAIPTTQTGTAMTRRIPAVARSNQPTISSAP